VLDAAEEALDAAAPLVERRVVGVLTLAMAMGGMTGSALIQTDPVMPNAWRS
jgi:hypothetical protein